MTVNVVILFEKTDICIQAAKEKTPSFSTQGQFLLCSDQISSQSKTRGTVISALQNQMCR